jgi:hypothetical protein
MRTVRKTVTEAIKAIMLRNEMRITRSPHRAIMTVRPARRRRWRLTINRE